MNLLMNQRTKHRNEIFDDISILIVDDEVR